MVEVLPRLKAGEHPWRTCWWRSSSLALVLHTHVADSAPAQSLTELAGATKTRLSRRDEIGLVLRAFEREHVGTEVTRVSKPKSGTFTAANFQPTFIDAHFDGCGAGGVSACVT